MDLLVTSTAASVAAPTPTLAVPVMRSRIRAPAFDEDSCLGVWRG
jgi:hypothetical protein